MDEPDDDDLMDPAVWPFLMSYLGTLPEVTEDESVIDPEPWV